jgi:tetratricopeptide (TPR) repeat protein
MSDTNFLYRPKEPPRVIRVFISSTFRDMQAERDELVKRIFPQLRKICEERGVNWSYVDLRWGVTDEQTAENKVLPICLDEIRICQPYFIGLLGERYGWVPEEVPSALLDQEKWLGDDPRRSITELEILHGVLNNPAMADHSLFYFRSPKYIDSLDPTDQPHYLEVPTEDEINRYGQKEAKRRAKERQDKLYSLKQRIETSQIPLRKDYPDPKTLGQFVLQDMTRIISTLYPDIKPIDPLDKEAAEHEAYALSRIPLEIRPGQQWGVYIGRQAYLDQLDLYAQRGGPPLAVLGESGSGKTALLAYWAVQYRQTHPDEMVFMHFIGATPNSTQLGAMLLRTMGELKRCFSLPGDLPTDPVWIRHYFPQWLETAASNGRVVLVIDGLNQLEDAGDALELSWLPQQLPENIRLILSSHSNKFQEELARRSYRTLEVQPLEVAERKQLIKKYLAQYSKALSDNLSELVASSRKSANPLLLRIVLAELCLYGDHDTLKQRIEYYLSSQTIPDLYAKVLERYEMDYDQERPELVREVFSLIWGARRGLSEAELLDLLGSRETPLVPALWAPLHLAIDQAIMNRSGYLGFSHDYLRQAVERRYLSAEAEQRAVHMRLADYFEIHTQGARRLGELPWQLTAAREFTRLYGLLGNVPFSIAVFQENALDLKRYWAQIEANTKHCMVEAYQAPVLSPEGYNYNDLWNLAVLLDEAGHIQEAFKIREYLYPRTTIPPMQASLLDFQAKSLIEQNRFDEALQLLDQEVAIGQSTASQIHIEASLVEQGKILHMQKRYDEALVVFERALQLSEKISHLHGRMIILGLKALTRRDQGFEDEAMQLFKEQETLARQLNEPDSVRSCLINQATVLAQQEKLPEALAIWEKQMTLAHEEGDVAEEAICLSNQAWALSKMGRVSEALPAAEKAYQMAKERNLTRLMSDFEPTLDSLRRSMNPPDEDFLFPGYPPQPENPALNTTFAKAWALARQEKVEDAVNLLQQTEQSCVRSDDISGAVTSALNRASLLGWSGYKRANHDDNSGAIALLDAGEKIFRSRVDYKKGLTAYITGKAQLLARMDRLGDANRLVMEADNLLTELEPDALTDRIKTVLDKIRAQLTASG